MQGTQLGSWELIEPIARGGNAEVWLARHTLLGREAAIKILLKHNDERPEDAARFVQEAQIAAQLRHKYIARVEDLGLMPDGSPYLVMERLHGETLAQRLKRLGVFTPRMLEDLLGPVCEALEHAHKAGVVHRDIKPENIFLALEDGKEVVKLVDFGIAKVFRPETFAKAQHETRIGVILGTPRYMSPEQLRGARDLDPRTDLWSLGLMAYLALTGRHPFRAKGSYEAVCAEILHGDILAPSCYSEELSRAIDEWMSRALERERTKRFQSAKEMFKAYQDALAETESFDEPTMQHKPTVDGGDGPSITVVPKVKTSSTKEINRALGKVQKPPELKVPQELADALQKVREDLAESAAKKPPTQRTGAQKRVSTTGAQAALRPTGKSIPPASAVTEGPSSRPSTAPKASETKGPEPKDLAQQRTRQIVLLSAVLFAVALLLVLVRAFK